MTRTVADKMRIRAGSRAHIVDGPAAVVAAMALPDLESTDDLVGEFDYLHLFVTTQDAMRHGFPPLAGRLRRGGALWVSWPKGRRHGSDLDLRSVIRIGYDLGMVESTCLRVDEAWAALRFTHPRPGRSYHNSYGTLARTTRQR